MTRRSFFALLAAPAVAALAACKSPFPAQPFEVDEIYRGMSGPPTGWHGDLTAIDDIETGGGPDPRRLHELHNSLRDRYPELGVVVFSSDGLWRSTR